MQLMMELPPRQDQLAAVRRVIDCWAETTGADAWKTGLVATELLTNAMAASPPECPISVVLQRDRTTSRVIVSNVGNRFGDDGTEMPPPSRRRGRGLAIVRRVADRLDIDNDNGHTVVAASV